MRIPAATYRVQFNPGFTFQDAKGVVSYLSALGISEIYASPIFKARKGSLHGYDIVDPNQLNPELGTGRDFEALAEAVKASGMGWLQDMVPNHMAFDYENAMLMDVLENGPSSPYFHFFDIDWDHPYESIKGRLLAPFLGKFYGKALEEGEIKIDYDAVGFSLHYYDLAFPLKIGSYLLLLTHRLGVLKRKLGANHPDFIKLLGILYVLRTFPSPEVEDERYEQINFIKSMLWELYSNSPSVRKFISENVRAFNGEKGNPESFKLLDGLLSEQLLRLSFWKVATEEINYRRFFGINDLISLRVEDEGVFDHTHSLIFKLVEEKQITGLRVDHIDGLYDPTLYLEQVRERAGNLYIVVEKILGLEEQLPSFWPVQGTTGYDFLNYANGLFCKKENEKSFSRLYSGFTGVKTPYESLVSEKKRLIMEKDMAGDIDNLAHLMKGISSRYRYASDITLHGLKRALVEVMVQLPIYRTYMRAEVLREEDSSYVKSAVKKAVQSCPGLLNELHFIESFLLLEFDSYLSEDDKSHWVQFVNRFQQFTGPLMAKGFEDTALYVYNRLLSLNEVGGSPSEFGISLGRFHTFCKMRLKGWPHALNATSTHDTKRGEDARARINVLSEIPQEWQKTLKTWSKINRGKKKRIHGIRVPERNDEYAFYQTLIGAFPFYKSEHPEFLERIKLHTVKAVREAKVYTGWLKPDTDYENGFVAFVEKMLDAARENPFLEQFVPFQGKIAFYGIFNSLAQALVKITSPGVPDFYQGTELWDFNLVDPDNRRPVDFEKRKAFLSYVNTKAEEDLPSLIEELLSTKEDGRIKLFLICRALMARKAKIRLFQNGSYLPLGVEGAFKDHIIAFARNKGDEWALTVVPRFLTALAQEGEYPLGMEVWQDTKIVMPEKAPGLWQNIFTEETIGGKQEFLIGDALRQFPVALLMNPNVAALG